LPKELTLEFAARKKERFLASLGMTVSVGLGWSLLPNEVKWSSRVVNPEPPTEENVLLI
jgi:hypothetical protein